MFELKPFLKKIIDLPGLSGFEDPICEVIAETWKPMVDELTISKVGSLHALKRGTGTEPRRRILLAAHMDSIGLMVTDTKNGFIYFTEIGSYDVRILPGQAVAVHGRKDLLGVIGQPPDRLLSEEQKGNPVRMELLFVDTGLEPLQVTKLVAPGDLISMAQSPFELGGDFFGGHSMDDRASIGAVTVCLSELQKMNHPWDVWAVATTQEEESYAGGFTSPFEIRPDIGIAVDVTFGRGNEGKDYRSHPLGGGAAIGMGPNVHTGLYRRMLKLAEQLDIPHLTEIMPRHSGTDAYPMQVVEAGIPTLTMGIPLRYMHSPIEIASLKDIERCGHLMAEFIARLEADVMEKIQWDEEA
jgi:putative aminopeptidase FrvX